MVLAFRSTLLVVVLFFLVLAPSLGLWPWRALAPLPGRLRRLVTLFEIPWTTFRSAKLGAALNFATPCDFIAAVHPKGTSLAASCSADAPTRKGGIVDEAGDSGSSALAGYEGTNGSDELGGTPSCWAPRSSGSVSRSLTELVPSHPPCGSTPRPLTSDSLQPFPA